MKFEEALMQMKQGKKITHECLGENVYFEACRFGFADEPIEERELSIVKMLGEKIHPDMGMDGSIDDMFYPGTLIPKPGAFQKPCKHGFGPQLELFLVMSDDWRVFNE